MSTIKKTIKFDNEPDVLQLDSYQVTLESNDTIEKLLVVIQDNAIQTIENEDGSVKITSKLKNFGYQLNKSKFAPLEGDEVFTQRVARSSQQRVAIYQFFLDYSELIVGENAINIYEVSQVSDPAAAPLTKPKEIKNLIGKKKFFLKEESNVTNVKLDRPGIEPTADEILWKAINEHYLKFKEYEEFIDTVICRDYNDPKTDPKGVLTTKNGQRSGYKIRSPFIKSEEYNLIKFATDFYMLKKFGLDTRQLSGYTISGKLPYYDIIVDRIKDDLKFVGNFPAIPQPGDDNDDCDIREYDRLFNPIMIELIWSYWMEQGMLVQTLNVINLRFQNIKGNNYIDRLMRFDTDPLRPLSHILWGYMQDEQHRLSLPRRLNEYDHEYGLTLTGRAVPRITPVDTRVKFLEAFHSLLTQCTIYFKESDDTTRIADAFPILNSLKEVHLLLAEGNHNAYGNLTWTARQEMMMQQYILSRPEMREFLGGRVMVPYPETWMDRVDTMRNIQGWGGTGIVHYYELAVHGELILLSIRYGNWSDVTLDRNNAANWAQRFRNSIQRYIHAYRSVTGVDLSVDQIVQLPSNFAIQPAYLIQQRLLENNARIRRA